MEEGKRKKRGRKEVSKKEKKARAVNDAMPKAPFGSVLSVCKAKAQVERRTDGQTNELLFGFRNFTSARARPRPCVRATVRPTDARAAFTLW